MAFDAMEQRRIMGCFATGVTVVTTRHEGQLCGMTANAVASLSLDPPLVLVAVDKRNQMHGSLTQGKCFAMNVLTDEQEAVSRQFAAPGPKDFSNLKLTEAETGAPILAEGLAFVDCYLTDIFPGGDHDIFVGEIVAGNANEGRPLIFYGGNYTQLVGSTTDGGA
jgi:flavin reductase (DIM6/NTAB) family NADH-FMN oxidoreductase RutF